MDDERSAFYKRLESATSASSLWTFGRYAADLALLRAKIPTGPPPSLDLFCEVERCNSLAHFFFSCRLYTRTYNAFERALSLAMLCL